MQKAARIRTALISVLYLVVVVAVSVVLVEAPAAAGSAAHEEIACGGCHVSGGFAKEAGGEQGSFARRCLSCHDAQIAIRVGGMQGFHRDRERSCTDCHSFHRPDRIRAGERTFDHQFGDERIAGHCASCHDGGVGRAVLVALSEGHAAAAAFYHTDSSALRDLTPSAACLACHSNGEIDPRLGGDGAVSPPRFNEHASHPYGVRVTLGAGDRFNHIRMQLDPRIRLFEGKIECLTCHDLTSDEDDRLVRFETKYEMCRGCHVHEASKREPMFAEVR